MWPERRDLEVSTFGVFNESLFRQAEATERALFKIEQKDPARYIGSHR